MDIPRQARQKSKSSIYHIMIRGANRQEIFHDEEDCRKFLDTIAKYKGKTEMNVYAWCLMSNHVHLLLKEGKEDVSVTMKRVGVSFVSFYNWKYRTTGHLFQDRFKSEKVETINYLLTVVRYIHQNPVKAGMVNRAEDWKWSSCPGYYDKEVYPRDLPDKTFILQMFSPEPSIAKERFKEFNERKNNDICLEDNWKDKKRLLDEEARIEIKKTLGSIEIAQIKSLPKLKRTEVLRKVKRIEGLSQRQAARILGVSPNLIFKA
jgi:putative transposase